RAPAGPCRPTCGRSGRGPASWAAAGRAWPSPPPPRGLLHAGVVPERAGGGELAELVADHRLGDVDGHVLAAVVDGDGVPDHVGDDGRAARPGLDDLLLALGVERVDLAEQVLVDERALLQRTGHGMPTSARRGYGGDARSTCRTACSSCGCGPRACPRATRDGGRPTTCPRRRRAGGRRGSWRRPGSAG